MGRGGQQQKDYGKTKGLALTRKAIVIAGILQTILYCITAVVTSIRFGTESGKIVRGFSHGNGNVLYNFPPDNYPISILSTLLVVCIILDYPVVQYPAIEGILSIVPQTAPHFLGDGTRAQRFYNWFPFSRHVLSFIFAIVCFTLVLFVKDLEDLFGLCGSLGISVYCYLLPGILLVRMGITRNRKHIPRMVFGAFSVAVGLTVLIGSTFFILQGLFNKSDS